MVATKADIVFAVSTVSQFMSKAGLLAHLSVTSALNTIGTWGTPE